MTPRLGRASSPSAANELAARSRTVDAMRAQGKRMLNTGRVGTYLADSALVGLATLVPFTLAAPPLAFIAAPTAATAVCLAREAKRRREHGELLLHRSVYYIDLNTFTDVLDAAPDLLGRLRDAGILTRHTVQTEYANRFNDVWLVNPHVSIPDVLRGGAFDDLSDDLRSDVGVRLGKIVKMGPLMQALRRSERALQEAIVRGDTGAAAEHSLAFATLRDQWHAQFAAPGEGDLIEL